MWRLRIEQYFQVQDLCLDYRDVIENGNSFKPVPQTTTNADGSSTLLIPGLVTTKEKVQKKNDVKARSMLLMALPNEHLMTFNQYKDAQTFSAAIQTRFGGNEATNKTQKSLLKQMYENFSAPSTESLDSIFNRLHKIVSQLAILDENISQEDLNLKFLRSLPSEWNTHVVVWRNKPDLVTMSFDDLYNNFKIVEQEFKGTATQAQAQVLIIWLLCHPLAVLMKLILLMKLVLLTLKLALLALKLALLDLESNLVDDIEEMDLKWQLALLSMRTRRFFQKTGRKITINRSDTARYDKSKVECFNCHKIGHFARECRGPRNQDSRNRNQDSSRRTINVEETSSKAMVAIDGAGFDWSYMADDEVPTNMALMAFSDSERSSNNLSLKYGPKTSKSASEDISNEVRESPNAPLVKELVSDDKLEKKISHPQKEDQGYVDSGCPRHMTRNMSYLSDFKEFDGGYVTFGGGAKGGTITRKGTLKTSKLDFKDVYFVKDLQFNLFSVSQMCDKKNSVLFTDTGCFVLSPDNKLADESQATLDESMLWHRMLGHVNFKNINKLVKKNLVRGLPLKHFENDQTCGACLKGKQHKASCDGPKWLFDIDVLTKSMNYVPVVAGKNSNNLVGIEESIGAGHSSKETGSSQTSILPLWKVWFTQIFDSSLKNASILVSQTMKMAKLQMEQGFISVVYEGKTHKDLHTCLFAYFLSQEEPKKVWTLVDLPHGKRAIGTKWVYRNKKDERGIVIRNKGGLVAQGYTREEGIDYDKVFAPVARIEAIRLFLAYASFKVFVVYQMDVKSAFPHRKIQEEFILSTPRPVPLILAAGSIRQWHRQNRATCFVDFLIKEVLPSMPFEDQVLRLS
ncbi:putative ribonuclease H-like domain-containing protein [Tanacetum coccineum]|uniref:Ribonuclease H-like domain-containing protein n=1 Tax=Tanacetum coccineum TaxID=301880 RepID=A0ABQ5BYJ5_9ASTR